jgi:hypothetical protein
VSTWSDICWRTNQLWSTTTRRATKIRSDYRLDDRGSIPGRVTNCLLRLWDPPSISTDGCSRGSAGGKRPDRRVNDITSILWFTSTSLIRLHVVVLRHREALPSAFTVSITTLGSGNAKLVQCERRKNGFVCMRSKVRILLNLRDPSSYVQQRPRCSLLCVNLRTAAVKSSTGTMHPRS